MPTIKVKSNTSDPTFFVALHALGEDAVISERCQIPINFEVLNSPVCSYIDSAVIFIGIYQEFIATFS